VQDETFHRSCIGKNLKLKFHCDFQVLGVSQTATQAEITSRWRKLSRENHPDKVKGKEDPRKAQDRFMEIQQAYDILSKVRSRQKARKKQSSDE